MTPENVRFHAAGHLAAAHALASTENVRGAKQILGIVRDYTEHALVSAPPALKELIAQSFEDPCKSLKEIALLENWFVDPFNTVIEKSGGRF